MTNGAHVPTREPSPANSSERLDSWKEIASYLKRSVRTVTRWERDEGLPVHRHVHSKTGTVYAFKPELDAWWTHRGRQIENEPLNTSSSWDLWFRRAWVPVAAGSTILVAAVAWFALRPNPPAAPPKLVPLTTYPGIEGPPSLSPDGNQVAFERNGDIFVKQVDGEALVQLTNTSVAEHAPAWSPDGRQIAFVRAGTGIFLISPLGGGERRVAETRVPLLLKTMAWTQDSKSVVISEMTSSICASLFLITVATGEKRRLTWPPEPSIGDGWPAVSHDGQTLAFARYPQDTSANIYLMPMGGGEPRQVTADKASLFGLAWTPDGRQLVFSSDRGGISRLWRVPANPTSLVSASPLESGGEDTRFPSISRPGLGTPVRLAYQRFEENVDIRRAEVVGEGTLQHALKPSAPFLASTRSDDHPQFSPNGRKIAFVSKRSGTFEIWLCDSDGSNVVRLTSMGGPIIVGPRWSPDSRRIAFFSTTGIAGKYLGYMMSAEGGSPWRLSDNDRDLEALPSWSRDARWIYFASGRSGALQIWKMPADGGQPVQISRGGGADASEAPGGRSVYYTKVAEIEPGLWSMPTDGGEEVRVLDSVWFGYWAVVRKGIYFIDFSVARGAPRPVKFFNFQNRQVTEIGSVEKTVAWDNTPGFAISPDSRWLLYSSLETTEADLMLVDNFR